MKNYHNNLGFAQFEPCRKKLVQLASALEDKKFTNASAERGFLLDTFCSLRQDHDVCESLGETGLGGSMNVAQWKAKAESCAVTQALKAIFIDFIELDFMPVEFLNATWDMMCEIQIYRVLSPCEE